MNDDQQFDLPLASGSGATSPASALFLTEDHHQLLEQLAYSAQFNGGIQVLEGEAETGKTTLAQALCSDYLAQAGKLEFILASESDDRALQSAATALGVPTPEGGAAGELLVQMRHFVQSLQNETKIAILVIDDAHKLSQSTLSAFASLLQGAMDTGYGLHLVLVSEPGLVERLDELQLVDIPVHDFNVPVLSLEEVDDFVAYWRALGDGSQKPAAMPEAGELWHRSQGRIGEIERLLQEAAEHASPGDAPRFDEDLLGEGLLQDSQSELANEELSQDSPRWSLAAIPRAHLGALGVLVVVLLVALVARQPGEPADQAEGIVRAQTVIPADALIGSPQSGSQARSVSEGAQAETVDSTKLVDSDAGSPNRDLALEPVVDDDELRQALYGQRSVPNVTGSGDGSAAEEPAEPAVADTQTDAEPSVAGPAQQVVEAVEQKAAAPAREATPQKAAAPATARADADVERLLALDPAHFSLQVMAASSEVSLKQFRDRQPNKSQLYIYQTRRQGKPWYVLLAGEYGSHKAAADAIASLPSAQRSGGPWPRRLDSVQQEIGTNREF